MPYDRGSRRHVPYCVWRRGHVAGSREFTIYDGASLSASRWGRPRSRTHLLGAKVHDVVGLEEHQQLDVGAGKRGTRSRRLAAGGLEACGAAGWSLLIVLGFKRGEQTPDSGCGLRLARAGVAGSRLRMPHAVARLPAATRDV